MKMIRTRIMSLIFGGAALIALGLMMSAFIQKVSADRQAEHAESARIVAEKEKIQADSSAIAAKMNEAEAERVSELAHCNNRLPKGCRDGKKTGEISTDTV